MSTDAEFLAIMGEENRTVDIEDPSAKDELYNIIGKPKEIDKEQQREIEALEKDEFRELIGAQKAGATDPVTEDIDAPSIASYIEASPTLKAGKSIVDLFYGVKNVVKDTASDMINTDQDLKDSLLFNYNKDIAQPLRDGLGINDKVQNKGAFYQPDFVKDPLTGEPVMTGNKSFNSYNDKELAYIDNQLSQRKGDETYYEMTYGDMTKRGYSKNDIFERYKNDPNFSKWLVTRATKTGAAADLERMKHGSVENRMNRASQYKDSKGGVPLIDGRTEVYNTPIKKKALEETNIILSDEQKEIKDNVVLSASQKLDTLKQKDVKQNTLADMELTKFWDTAKNETDPTKLAELLTQRKAALNAKRDMKITKDDGTLATIGKTIGNALTPSDTVISEDMLESTPAYQQLAQSMDGDIFDLGGNKVSPQEKAKNLSNMLSGMNWNMTTMFSKIPQLRGNKKLAGNLADALEAYNATDTDANQVVRGAGNMATDPTNVIGFAASGINKLVGKNAAKQGLIKQLKSYAGRMASKPLAMTANTLKQPTVTTGATGAGFTGLFDAGTQSINIMGGKKDEFDFEQNGKAMALGFAGGVGLAKTLSAFTGKANTTPQVTVDEFDTMIAQMTKKAGDNKIPREERGLYRKEVIRMRKYRDKVAAIKENADAKANYNKQMKIIEEMKVDIAREARRPNAHPNVAKFYGLESFEKNKQSVLTEKNAANEIAKVNQKNKDIDAEIDTKKSEIENPNTSKEKDVSESLDVTEFKETNNLTRETRQSKQDVGEEINVDNTSQKLDEGVSAYTANKKKEAEIVSWGQGRHGNTEKQVEALGAIDRANKKIEKSTPGLHKEIKRRKDVKIVKKKIEKLEKSEMELASRKEFFKKRLEIEKQKLSNITSEGYAKQRAQKSVDEWKKNVEDLKNENVELELKKLKKDLQALESNTQDKSIPNKQKEIEMEERGASKRGFQKGGYADGHQQGKTGLSQMKMVNKKPNMKSIDEVDAYVSQRVKNFQEKEAMISTYGQNVAIHGRDKISGKPLKKVKYTPEESIGRRSSYELSEITSLLKSKNISPEVKANLTKRAHDLLTYVKSVKKPGVMTGRMRQKIKDFDDLQYKKNKEYNNSARNTEVSEAYKFLKKAGEEDKTINNKPNHKYSEWSESQQFSPYNSKKLSDGTRRPTTTAEKSKFIKKLYKKIQGEHRKIGKRVGRLEDRIRNQLLAKGIQDDLSVLPKKGVDMDAVREVQLYRDLADDIKAFENKQISHEELLYRETERMDNTIDTAFKEEMNKNNAAPYEAMERVIKKYDDLGIHTKGDIELPAKYDNESLRLTRVADNKFKYGHWQIHKESNGTYSVVKGDGTKQLGFKTINKAKAEVERRIKYFEDQKKPELDAKKAEKELAEKEYNESRYEEQLSKFKAYVGRNNVNERRTATNRGQVGKYKVTEKQAEYLDAGITPEEVARLQHPEGATKKTLPFLKKLAKKQLNTKLNDISRKRLGVPSDVRFMEKPPRITFEETMIDASNSMLQMMAVLTRSTAFGDYSKLTGGNKDVRTIIGKEMSRRMKLPKDEHGNIRLNEEGETGSWKDFVKPLFMTENYGQGEKGLVNTLMDKFNFTPEQATTFYKEYKTASDKIFPQIKAFRDMINQRMKFPELGSEIHWTMPDGTRIALDISKDVNGQYKIRSQTNDLVVKTDELDTFSASLMPTYIQPYDAWVAKRMRDKGYATNHDAFVPGEFKTEAQMQKDYGEILSEILDSDSFAKNMKEIMPEKVLPDGTKSITPTKPYGNLTKEDIMSSPNKMAIEHSPEHNGDVAKVRKPENDAWKTDEELMREFMASSNIRMIDTHSLTDSIVDNIGRNTKFAKVTKNQDVFERQASLATLSEKYNPEHAIDAPKGVDKKTWDMTQRNIFYESRAKLEQNPNANEALKGERIFFQENGKPVGDNKLTYKEVEQMFRLEDFKSKVEYNKAIKGEKARIDANNKKLQKEIIDLENQKGKAIFSNFTEREKIMSQRIGKSYIQMARKVKSWNSSKLMNDAEMFAHAVVEDARKNIASNGKSNSLMDKKKMNQWQAYYVRQVIENEPSYKQLQELNNLAKKFGNDSARYQEGIRKAIRKDIPKGEEEMWTKNLLETDYAAIDGWTKDMANKFMKDFENDYKIAKKYIDAAVKGLGKPEHQVGFYQNNALGIVRKLGLSEDLVPMYDQMISVKAMTDEAWKFIEERKNTPGFRSTMKRIKYNQKVSKDILFKENPESYIKGYTDQGINPNYTLDKNGERIYATESSQRGHLDVELENKKRGREIAELTDPELKERSGELWKRVEEIEHEIAPTKEARKSLNLRTMNDNRTKMIEIQEKIDNLESKVSLSPKQEETLLKSREILESMKKNDEIKSKKLEKNGLNKFQVDKAIDNAGPRTPREIEVMKDSVEAKQALIAVIDELDKKTGGALQLNRPITDSNMHVAGKRNIKLTEKDVRQVAGTEIREDLGRSHDIIEILTKTLGDTEVKLGRRKKVEMMNKSNFDLLYSKTSKPGFVKLEDDVLRGLPKGLQENAKYVNNEFYTQLVGRKNVSFTENSSQGWKVVDRLVRDATTRFKKNNVLSNSASHVNALMYNQAIAPSIGITPKNQVRYQKEAMMAMREVQVLSEKIADRHSRGLSIDGLMKRLKKNELYQMEQNGLSTNTIDGIAQEPDLWRQITSDGLGFIESKVGTKFNKTRAAANNLFAEGDSLVGQGFNKSFTAIDTTGRFMTTKHFMTKEGGGLSLVEATRKTNGLFGDMDQIAPKIIDFFDKYPAIPFMKWWTSVAPQTFKTLAMENPTKALLMAMAVYGIMQGSKDEKSKGGSGIRTTGANPVFSNIDFMHDSTIGSYDSFMNDAGRNTSVGEMAWRRTSKYALPSFITKPVNQIMIGKGAGDIAKSFAISNADENYKDIKGSPLELKGITDELIQEELLGKPHFSK